MHYGKGVIVLNFHENHNTKKFYNIIFNFNSIYIT